ARLYLPQQLAAQRLALRQRRWVDQRVGAALGLDHRVERGGRVPGAATGGVVASVRDDAQQPCLERAPAEAADRGVGRQERVLGRVGGSLAVAERAVGDAVGEVLVLLDQPVERHDVAACGAPGQLALVQGARVILVSAQEGQVAGDRQVTRFFVVRGQRENRRPDGRRRLPGTQPRDSRGGSARRGVRL